MTVNISCVQRCLRNVIGYDYVSRCPLLQNPHLFAEYALCNFCVVPKEHLRNLCPRCCGVAEIMPVQSARCFHGFKHVVCVSVSAETDEYASAHLFHGGRTSDGVPHVALRIVYYYSISFLYNIHLKRRYVNAVSCYGFFSEYAEVVKPLYYALVVL